MAYQALRLLLFACPALALTVSTPVAGPRIHVCTNKACKRAGSLDTLALLRALASTTPLPSTTADIAAATLQQTHAMSKIEACGCLGGCGNGPNVVATHTGQVFYDVYKPITALALVQEELGLEVPDVAANVYLKKMYADRAMRSNKVRCFPAPSLTHCPTETCGPSIHLDMILLTGRCLRRSPKRRWGCSQRR